MPGKFPKGARLRKRGEFVDVQKRGRRHVATHFLLLLVSESNKEAGARSRVGITVTTKVGNAVTRNRLKRWTREYVRLHPKELPAGDLVVVAKASAAEATHAQVDDDLAGLFRRARGAAPR